MERVGSSLARSVLLSSSRAIYLSPPPWTHLGRIFCAKKLSQSCQQEEAEEAGEENWSRTEPLRAGSHEQRRDCQEERTLGQHFFAHLPPQRAPCPGPHSLRHPLCTQEEKTSQRMGWSRSQKPRLCHKPATSQPQRLVHCWAGEHQRCIYSHSIQRERKWS